MSNITDLKPPFPLPLLVFKRSACAPYRKKLNAYRRAMASGNTYHLTWKTGLQPRCEFATAALNVP